MKQVYIHIGLHKTGSTYIQKIFAANRDVLRAEGIHYPELGAEFLFGHHNFAWSYIPGHVFKGTDTFSQTAFLTALKKVDVENILISSEDFEFLERSHILALKQSLSDYRTHVVMYVRNPVSALYSRWQESVKHGDLTSLLDYYRKTFNNPAPMNYALVADTWANVFGSNAMKIVIYDNLLAEESNIALYFLNQVLGVSIQPETLSMPQGKVNVANGLGVIEVLRQLNEIHRESGHDDNLVSPFMKFILRHPRGQQLKQYMQTMCKESPDFINLSELDNLFANVAQQLLANHTPSILNAHSAEQLFTGSASARLPMLKSQAVAKQVDLKALYKLLTD